MKTIKITADNKISIVDVDFSNNRAIMDAMGGPVEVVTTNIWDEKAIERGEDKPVKQFDHCMDAARYFAYTIIRRERKWS